MVTTKKGWESSPCEALPSRDSPMPTGISARFPQKITDWRPFWSQLGEHLADEARRRWPLKRRTGKLRKSLVWHGDRLGRGGVFEAANDRLRFGTNVFYGRFPQSGTKRQRMTPLIHVETT